MLPANRFLAAIQGTQSAHVKRGTRNPQWVEEVRMSASNRSLLWVLVAVGAFLVLVPIVGPLTMGGGMTAGPMMFGMYVVGLVWLVATFVVIAALVALMRRDAKRA
jgi:hypothetical protein